MKAWFKAAGIRAIKTAAEAVLVLTGTSAVNVLTLNLVEIGGVAAGMALVSILLSIAGIPEVDDGASIFSAGTLEKRGE